MGPTDLTEYFVQDVRITYTTTTSSNGTENAIKVELVFGQRLLSYVLKTFLPTIIICLASFTTSYYKAAFFEAIVTVNLTSLLVLTTMFISVMESLPQTYYAKMMDIWLIFVLCLPFLEVLLHTFMEMTRYVHNQAATFSCIEPNSFSGRRMTNWPILRTSVAWVASPPFANFSTRRSKIGTIFSRFVKVYIVRKKVACSVVSV